MAKPLEMQVQVIPILPKDKQWPVSVFDRLDKKIKLWLEGPVNKMLVADFKTTVRRWDHQPEFEGKYSRYRKGHALTVKPKGRYTTQWVRISQGVKGHMIFPKRAVTLKFKTDYAPHTTAGGVWTGPGKYYGGWVAANAVNWPGIEKREFERKIMQKREATIRAQFRALVRGIAK